MAFNASVISSRYSAAGNVPVLKTDFVKIAADLTVLETFAATASSNAGKYSKFLLAEVTATPATNIQLFHLNTGGYASTTNNGMWKQILLSSDSTATPATNIQLFHLNTNGYASTGSLGKWNHLLLDKTASLPGSTNIAVADLSRTASVFTVAVGQAFPTTWNTFGNLPTQPGQSATAVPFFLTSTSIGTDAGTQQFYWVGLSATSNNIDSSITMGVICEVGCVQVSGVRVFMPIFIFFGSTGSQTISYFGNAKIYEIKEN